VTELREATVADVEFYYRVVVATIRPYVEQTWGAFDEAANAARRLYEREGFRVTSTTAERTFMELAP
jgi:hypothetical protein